jgi:hypothetical protein
VRGFQGLLESVDLVVVAAFEVGELGGEGANHAAGLVGVHPLRAGCRGRSSLLVAELFDTASDLGVAVEEVQRDACGGPGRGR